MQPAGSFISPIYSDRDEMTRKQSKSEMDFVLALEMIWNVVDVLLSTASGQKILSRIIPVIRSRQHVIRRGRCSVWSTSTARIPEQIGRIPNIR